MRRRATSVCLALVLAAMGCQQKAAAPPESIPEPSPAPAAAAMDTAVWVVSGDGVTTPTGLRYWDLEVGTGTEARKGMSVQVHYVGRFEDGRIFDDSYQRGRPIPFVLGAGGVIQGWEQGIEGMRVGGKRKLVIPPSLAYGERGYGGVIPPNATLVFQVVLADAR